MTFRIMSHAFAVAFALIAALDASAQQDGKAGDRRPPVVFTTQRDHQNMLDQLGITKFGIASRQ